MVNVEPTQLKKEIVCVENLVATRKLRHLKFERRSLERGYLDFNREHITKVIRQNALIALIFSLLYTLAGVFVVPGGAALQWLGLYLIICFSTLVGLFFCYLDQFRRPEIYMAAGAFMCTTTLLLALAVTPTPMHQILVVTALMIYFCTHASTLVPFILAVATCVTSLSLSFAVLLLLGADFDWKISAFVLIGGNAVGASISYLNEFLMRKSFLQRYLLTLEKRHLRTISRQFETQSLIDPLTNIANRRHFNMNYKLEWLRSFRNRQPMSLIFVDIDHYKKFNDHYGHQVGDTCLKDIAKNLEALVERSGGMVSRYGGEEFIVLLPGTDRLASVCVAKRIQEHIQEMRYPHAASPVAPYVTLSLGIATTVPMSQEGHAYLIEAADKALYQAKANGRNRWCVYRSNPSHKSTGVVASPILPEHTLPIEDISRDPIQHIGHSYDTSWLRPHDFADTIKSRVSRCLRTQPQSAESDFEIAQ